MKDLNISIIKFIKFSKIITEIETKINAKVKITAVFKLNISHRAANAKTGMMYIDFFT